MITQPPPVPTAAPLPPLHDPGSLEYRVAVMKQEIDALQIASAQGARPWYRNVSTLLSIIALMFSFGTTFVSYRRASLQDLQSTRQELRGLLQRIAALPKEHMDAGLKFGVNTQAANVLSSMINQENSLLARTAAEITSKLPAGTVSAMEYSAVGWALQQSYDLDGAERFMNLAMQAQPDFNAEIAVLRMIANLKFIRGQPDAGRVDYQKALNIFTQHSHFDAYTRAQTNVATEINWAKAEANSNNAALAAQHLDSAGRIAAALPESPVRQALQKQVADVRAEIFYPALPSLGPPASGAPSGPVTPPARLELSP